MIKPDHKVWLQSESLKTFKCHIHFSNSQVQTVCKHHMSPVMLTMDALFLKSPCAVICSFLPPLPGDQAIGLVGTVFKSQKWTVWSLVIWKLRQFQEPFPLKMGLM